MMKLFCAPFRHQFAAVAFCLAGACSAIAQDKTTYTDHVLPLIESHCAKCHNPDKKKGDLDLTTYQGTLKGGGSGAAVVPGNPDSSRLWKSIVQSEDPTMPPNKPPLPEKELAVFKKWIAGGLLESSGSKAIVASKPTVDLSLKVSNTGKPEGPPPMPRELPIEPVLHTARGNPINGLAVSPWAPLVAVAGQKQILLYHTDTLALLGILPFSEGQPWDLKFSRSGKLLIAGGGHGAKSGRVLLWNVETGARIATVGNEYDTVLAADLSPDQARVALGGPDRLIKIYSTKSGELEHKLKKHTDWVTALAFSPDGEFLATGDRNGGVSLWDSESGQELFTTAGHKSAVTAVNWRSDSKLVASSSEDGTAKLWETGEGKLAKTWNAHAAGVLCIAYARDGKIVTSGRDGAVTTWDASGTKLKSFDLSGEPALRCAYTHDGARVIATDFAGRVAVWEAKDGKRAGELDANPLPLAAQLTAAQRKVEELQSRGDQPSPAVVSAEKELARFTTELEATKVLAEKARAEFATKAQEVVRLKVLSTQATPPADVADKLAAARATREQARESNTNAAVKLARLEQDFAGARDKLGALRSAKDGPAELAAARATVARLKVALSLSTLQRARAAVATRKGEVEKLEALIASKQGDIKKLNDDLSMAKDSAARSKLKTDLKAAASELKNAEAELAKAKAGLKAEQASLDRLTLEHEQVKSAPVTPPSGSKG